MKITAVIISFNPNCESLFNNIKSYDKNVDEIIVVDNSTELDLKTCIKSMCENSQFIYHDMNGNKGIAAALNIGFDYAIKSRAEWVLTMDQDSSFVSDLESYKSYIRNNDCSKLLLLAPLYNYHNINEIKNVVSSNPTIVPQSGNLVKLSNYIKLGPYREDYFIDFVDYEYCLRAKSQNLLLHQINSEILNHESGVCATISFLGIKYNYFESTPIRYYFVVRNGLKTAIIYKNLHSLFIVLKTIMRIIILENNKIIKLKFILKGGQDFLKSNFGGL
jgi:rhamnosyltransferase